MIKLRNLKIHTKLIALTIFILLINGIVMGALYYNYAYNDIKKNYYSNSQDIVSQISKYIQEKNKDITTKVHAMYNNNSFYFPMKKYLDNTEMDQGEYIIMSGNIADMISAFYFGDNYINSVLLVTEQNVFDDYKRNRNYEYNFYDSEMFQYFENNENTTIGWFPAEKSPFFNGEEIVIPVIYKMKINRNYYYMVVNINQEYIEDYLSNTYASYDYFAIFSEAGDLVIGENEKYNQALKRHYYKDNEKINPVDSNKLTYNSEEYISTFDKIAGANWTVYGMRSVSSLSENINNLRYFVVMIIAISILLSIFPLVILSNSITIPIKKLSKAMNNARKDNYKNNFIYDSKDEVGELCISFNYMLLKINNLLNELNISIKAVKKEKELVKKVEKQKRETELMALQSQINPHFLYNTLNTITWQAIDQGADEIGVMSSSLGKFFRISLNSGKEYMTLDKEVEHIIRYLDIEKIRYKDMIEYEINIDELLNNVKVMKLILQPLIENSIYHGAKVKNAKCTIKIFTEIISDNEFQLIVYDNGYGIPIQKLKEINMELFKGGIDKSCGYGIFNVNERIRLAFGDKYGLCMQSQYKYWTKAILRLPIK